MTTRGPRRSCGRGARRPARTAAWPFFLFLLAACGQSEAETAPADVSAGEARALDEAAAMLEEQRHEPEGAKASDESASPGSPSAPE